MPPFDLAELPRPLPAYFAALDRRTLTDLFTDDAIVYDEGSTLREPQAIADWLKWVETNYRPRYQVVSAQTVGSHSTVSFVVSGSFPGSPLALRQSFVTRDGKIERQDRAAGNSVTALSRLGTVLRD